MQTKIAFPLGSDLQVTIDIQRRDSRDVRHFSARDIPSELETKGFSDGWQACTLTFALGQRRLVMKGKRLARFGDAPLRCFCPAGPVQEGARTLPVGRLHRGVCAPTTIGQATRAAARMLSQSPVHYPFFVTGVKHTRRRTHRRLTEGEHHIERVNLWVWAQDAHAATARQATGLTHAEVTLCPHLPCRMGGAVAYAIDLPTLYPEHAPVASDWAARYRTMATA